MNRADNITAIAGDPGGANALGPVLQELLREGRAVSALAYGQAGSVWNRRAIPFVEVDGSITPAQAGERLKAVEVTRLLTGTSFNSLNLERRFIVGARRAGISSLTVLDFWSNYRVRFADERGELAFLPDRIAVMDDWARKDMIAEGFPPDRLCVTGQPAFDELAEFRRSYSPQQGQQVRARLGVGEDQRLVLFASQPLANVYGSDPSSPLFPGYTEHTVLEALIEALEKIASRRNEKVMLLVRPHPRENADDLRRPSTDHVRVVVDSQGDVRTIALTADLVTGMSTVLLVEACLLGCVVVSLQPGLRGADAVPTNRWGVSRPVYESDDIEPALEGYLFGSATRAKAVALTANYRVEPGAARRVVQLLDCLQTTRNGDRDE
jgi:hypothetical protein